MTPFASTVSLSPGDVNMTSSPRQYHVPLPVTWRSKVSRLSISCESWRYATNSLRNVFVPIISATLRQSATFTPITTASGHSTYEQIICTTCRQWLIWRTLGRNISDVALVGCVAQLAERRSLAGELNWPCPARGLQLTGDHYVGKPSAAGQPTRPTQPFILPGSINEK